MFKKLGEKLRDKKPDKLLAHLVSLGIDAELVKKGAYEDIGKPSLWEMNASDMGSIKINGKEIDVIQVTKYSGAEYGPTYRIDYAVKGRIGAKEERVMAKTKLKKKGFVHKIGWTSGGILDISWTGGEIADLLNEDESLKELMLREQIPKFGIIEIKPDKNKPFVRISTGEIFPSEKEFECYNTIAKHISSLIQ
ncbi:MAG: hypothetical protein JSV51_03005 [Candidatus Bathyarchaeota archaeon]|nr:MAG: hypothetical protein JSV51_03005 [Candidatus Bathyarchaeota archaeon]